MSRILELNYIVRIARNKRTGSLEYFIILYDIKSNCTKGYETKICCFGHNDVNVSSGEETFHPPKGRAVLPTVLSSRISIIGEFYSRFLWNLSFHMETMLSYLTNRIFHCEREPFLGYFFYCYLIHWIK